MPRDYKHHARSNGGGKSRRKTSRKKKKQPTPGWVWFVAGILISGGAFGAYLYLEKQNEKPEKRTVVVEQKPVKKQAAKKPENKPRQEKPRHPQFEFYSVLPEMEVEVPPEALRPSPGVTKTPTTRTGIYQLQVASYRSSGDAERMKASLALKGISSRVEKVSVNDKTYYRVRSGPYNRDQAYSLHTRLKSNKIDSLVIRIKK